MISRHAGLKITDLEVVFPTSSGEIKVVDGVSLEIGQAESFGLIGETGAGKSLTAWAALDLVPPPGRVTRGSADFAGQRLTGVGDDGLRHIRGAQIGVIVQDARSALNPVLSVRDQMRNTLRAHRTRSDESAESSLDDALRAVGIADRRRVLRSYPHQLSGGQAQRVLIAVALANRPSLLIADEPTTGLDVTIQAEILDLLQDLTQEEGRSLWLITHDLGIVANYTERVAVMFAGQIVEQARTAEFFSSPLHPYSAALVGAMAEVGTPNSDSALRVTGPPPNLRDRPEGCQFAYRCPLREDMCLRTMPQLVELSPGHSVRCLVVERAHRPSTA